MGSPCSAHSVSATSTAVMSIQMRASERWVMTQAAGRSTSR